MKFLNKIERKFGRYAIKNLMTYIIILYAVGWFVMMVSPEFYYNVLAFSANRILHGEVWRLVTFIIAPPGETSFFFMFITLYLYFILGVNLERAWGSFRFNFYFFMGILFHVIAGFAVYFIFGIDWPISTYYLNMSLFFAFATIYPDMEFLLFFILPVKVKWLAILDAIYFGVIIFFGYTFEFLPYSVQVVVYRIMYSMGTLPHPALATVALVSILNFILFFFMTRNYKRISPREIKRKSDFRKQVNRNRHGSARHKCDICGRTSETNPELTFRYCSKCNGNHEYCQEHLFTHKHVE